MDSIPARADLRQALRQVDVVHRMIAAYPEQLVLAESAADIERAWRDGRIASLIGLEGGHAIQGTLAAVRMFHRLGVRYITLTHNATTDWADAAMDYPRHHGLTEFGEEVVREMNRVGILVDLSHVSPETMRDAMRVSTVPVIFSHSSARALVDQPRNVPDDVLRLLKTNGGVIMVSFVPEFTSPEALAWLARHDSAMETFRAESNDNDAIAARRTEWVRMHAPPTATVQQVADHIDHVRSIAGIDRHWLRFRRHRAGRAGAGGYEHIPEPVRGAAPAGLRGGGPGKDRIGEPAAGAASSGGGRRPLATARSASPDVRSRNLSSGNRAERGADARSRRRPRPRSRHR
jgi:microsomal dipeptidase-like Zn-dependent dipeptidase